MPRRLLLAVCVLAVTPAFLACGDDDGGEGSPSPGATGASATQTSAGGASPVLAKPASKYSISIDDLGQNFRTDIAGTFLLDAKTYAYEASIGTTRVRLFATEADGNKKLSEWGYVEGFQTGYIPEGISGPESALLQGGFYITVETHLFKDADGAEAAYDYFENYLKTGGAQRAEAEPVGNKSSTWVTVGGKIGKTPVNAMYHQLLFVRGNVLTIVFTKGAQGFMKPEIARALALISDQKALGERAATEPTPTSNTQSPSATPRQ